MAIWLHTTRIVHPEAIFRGERPHFATLSDLPDELYLKYLYFGTGKVYLQSN
jgi:hypothetical protein